jgi:hypothetical protein
MKTKIKKIKKSNLTRFTADIILSFCENLAELGCPKEEKDVDMWYRYLTPKQQNEVAEKLLCIIERTQKNT